MKLYFMPGACSLAVHIALREAGLSVALVEVDYDSRKTDNGDDFYKINPTGCVPALVLDDGSILTEVPVIMQYVDGMVPGAKLLPAGGLERYRALEWLNFIATEVHKSFSPLYRRTTPVEFLMPGRDHLCRRLDVVEQCLIQQPYLTGSLFTLADVYLFTVCRWLGEQDLALTNWPGLNRHFSRISRRNAVQAAMQHEGLARCASDSNKDD